MKFVRPSVALLLSAAVIGCAGPVEPARSSVPPARSPAPSVDRDAARHVHPPALAHRSTRPRARSRPGEPISIADLSGRIVFDDFEDVFAMDVDGSNVVRVAAEPGGPEFDGAWSPDGEWVVYRDSTRGINEDDEIFVARADGSERRNITNDPANDWGPDWSPDGIDHRLQLGPRRRPAPRLPRGPRRLEPPPARHRRLGRVPVVLARRHADRVHGPRRHRTTRSSSPTSRPGPASS